MQNYKNKILSALVDALSIQLDRSFERLEAAGVCDSPIEKALAIALVHSFRVADAEIEMTRQEDISKFPKGIFLIVPQFRFENYHIDFALIRDDRQLFIECDGHDFHERTKDQAAHDRKKDRAIQAAGIRILRFTGSEIYKDPCACVVQIINSFNTLFDQPTKAEVEALKAEQEHKLDAHAADRVRTSRKRDTQQTGVPA